MIKGDWYKETEGIFFFARSHIDEIIAILFIFLRCLAFFLMREKLRGKIYNKRNEKI